jgi:mono/diheme cytochrome c family protein
VRLPLAPAKLKSHSHARALVVSQLVVAGALLLACDRTPADLREWTADDHDRAEEPKNGRGAPARVAPPQASANVDPNAALVDVTWRNQCALCHGLLGKGDGPQGIMVHAPDLTRTEWQNGVSDEQIAATIQNGKNRMPKFDFPPEVLRGLTARIRSAKGR